MAQPRALIVDDEPDLCELLAITLGRMGLATTVAATLHAARAALAASSFDLCLTDMRLPDGSGLDLVQLIQQRYAALPVAVITAHGSMEAAIQALKAGAFDFVNKPVDLHNLRKLVAQAVTLAGPAPLGAVHAPLIGRSPHMERLHETITKLSRSQAPVHISGESGTGKELVARLIHAQSPRASQPFVPVNCGAIAPDLIESELFGHIRGSFTGAIGDKMGLFEAADGGSLFLDEVAELPLALQVKLLRAVQEKRIRRVGAAHEQPIDCRILSATHKDLASMVGAGVFRQDLYYRINVIEVKVSPLRERSEDIAPLTEYFLTRIGQAAGAAAPPLSLPARAALQAYRFPGNVRELENILERACALCDTGTIEVADLLLPSLPVAAGPPAGELQPWLDELERQRILEALGQTRWNKTRAAKLLGISFRALRYRLERLGLS
ncbi:MAG: sigma-54-dependent Fis family transcriptional regulator [Gammaproteobacteria bacterium]|nr:sigma-54-dependent Fis family transcriptional regulator [Gammaproteobacteria bacterium]